MAGQLIDTSEMKWRAEQGKVLIDGDATTTLDILSLASEHMCFGLRV